MPHIQRALEGCNMTNTAQARASQATANRNCNANNSVQWQLQCAELYEVRLLQSDSPHSAAGCRTSAQQAYFLVEYRTSHCPSLVDWRLAPNRDSRGGGELHLAGEKPSPQVSELKGVVWLQENREDCERAAGQ